MPNEKQKSFIESQSEILTVMNVLTSKPEEQDKAIALLQTGMKETMQYQPGFISANIHKSLDSNHILVYAQWRARTQV